MPSTPSSHLSIPHSNGVKKTRATSCTSCRQVKLKCDLREKFPTPCSRCAKGLLKCETDASFKRVAARSRVRELEQQIDRLNRSKVLERSEVHAQGTPPTSAGSGHSTIGNPNSEAHSPQIRDWLNVSAACSETQFSLYECVLSYLEALDLYQYFARYHEPHFRVLDQVNSLAKLVEDSEFLFWTIVVVAARSHARHHGRYPQIQTSHARLYGKMCCEAIQNPLDLQAILMLCAWPYPVRGQLKDPSWMQLTMAIGAARQMGLDKTTDEVFFGTRRARYQLRNFSSFSLKLTWLKCFEMDVQFSLWHGNLPNLASSQHFRSVTAFCRDPRIPREVANTMEIHIRTSQYLLLIEDSLATQPQSNLVAIILQDLESLKTSNILTWSLQNDLALDTAKMYLLMTCFVRLTQDRLDRNQIGNVSIAFAKDLLESAKSCATQLITRYSAVSDEMQHNCPDHLEKSHPLPGYPKHSSRIVFFAATVLLRYLDSDIDHRTNANEATRNAFQRAHLFFRSWPLSYEHTTAGQTLEIAGRAIGHQQAHLGNPITTRMGASVMYNVLWLGGLLRGRDKMAEYSTEAQRSETRKESLIERTAGAHDSTAVQDQSQTSNWNGWDLSAWDFDTSALDFPFGVWDDAIYDALASVSLAALPDIWSNPHDNIQP